LKFKALKHWKSTAGGFLTVSLTTSTAILAVPGVNTFIQPKHLTFLMIGQAVAKVWISLIQEDAGETAGGIAVAFGAPAMLVNLAENWIHKVIATEALAVAAGQQDGSGTQKAAAVLNAMEPVVAAYFPSATQDQMKKANDAIVAFLNAFEAPPAAPVVPTKAGA
jgi:hypothetical protein